MVRPVKRWPAISLLLARFADHLHVGDLQMAMFVIAFRHATVLRSIFCVFLHVVHLRVRHYAGCGNSAAHMLGQRYFAAAYFPGAAVLTGEPELVGAVTL